MVARCYTDQAGAIDATDRSTRSEAVKGIYRENGQTNQGFHSHISANRSNTLDDRHAAPKVLAPASLFVGERMQRSTEDAAKNAKRS